MTLKTFREIPPRIRAEQNTGVWSASVMQAIKSASLNHMDNTTMTIVLLDDTVLVLGQEDWLVLYPDGTGTVLSNTVFNQTYEAEA